MDTDTVEGVTVPVEDCDPGSDTRGVSNDNGTVEGIPSDKEVMRGVGSALLRIELDLACTSEKLVNMNQLMMHVAERECDFEAFASEKDEVLAASPVKAMEFDVLSGIFDSEVNEMDKFIGLLRREISHACQIITSLEHMGDSFSALEEKLGDAEESMKQSQEQVSEFKMQSAKFQRIAASASGVGTPDEDKDVVISEDSDFLTTTSKIQMQTAQEQRHILRMLEKSLARELDLEKQLTDCTQALEKMKHRLRSSKEEVLSMEQETVTIYARFLEADNASVILMGISKDLTCKLQSSQLKLNMAEHRESGLNSRLQNCTQTIKKLEKEKVVLEELVEKTSSEASTLKDKVNSLEEKLKESESMLLSGNASLDGYSKQVKELEEKLVEAECRTEKAEAECKLLAETINGLYEELGLLKSSAVSNEKVESLQKQLMETDAQLQMAMAVVDASQEKQSMLNSSINDMETLIENLKFKVAKADARADSAEDKCIILSETNAELSEELSFLRSKLECLEASLQRAGETKLETAKDIGIRTKMITDLVMKLAMERERLHNQICLLMKENRALVHKLDIANKMALKPTNSEGGQNEKGVPFSEGCEHSTNSRKRNQGRELSHTTEVENLADDVLEGEHEPDSQIIDSKIETVRTIDAGRLSMKHALSAVLIALIAVLAVCFLRPESCLF